MLNPAPQLIVLGNNAFLFFLDTLNFYLKPLEPELFAIFSRFCSCNLAVTVLVPLQSVAKLELSFSYTLLLISSLQLVYF